jgi:Probable zinc-ribbon domain
MSNRELADKDLRCATCGDGFVFSAGEQELYRLRGITEQPQNCPHCKRAHIPSSLGNPKHAPA